MGIRISLAMTSTRLRSVWNALSKSPLSLWAVLATAFLGGCTWLVGGESSFRVHVKIESTEPRERCTIQLYRADTGILVSTRSNIDREFSEGFVIAPGSHKYYMVVSCTSTASKYKSGPYDLGPTKQDKERIELGEISL